MPYETDRSRGKNAMDAGNQQGRPNEQIGHYIAGFVDGEGDLGSSGTLRDYTPDTLRVKI